MSENGKKTVYTACCLCYQSCGVEVTVEDGKVTAVKGQESHPMNKGILCAKGQAMIEHLYHPDRLKYPLKKVDGKFQQISWEQAYSEIAAKLKELKEEFDPSVLAFFCGSIGVENLEMGSLTHRFKAAFGSPNFFSVESICFRMRIRSRQITFGKYPVEEMDSNLYVLWGHNPAASDIALSIAIQENLKKGAKVVVIDPRRIAIADQAEMYLAIRPGTDGALALALINVIINEDLVDWEFLRTFTDCATLVRADNGMRLRASDVGLGSDAEFVVWDEEADAFSSSRWTASGSPKSFGPASGARERRRSKASRSK